MAELILAEHFGDNARTNRSAAFTDSELQLLFYGNGLDKLNGDGYVVTGHNHFGAFGKVDRTGNVGSSDEELRTIVVEERSVTSAFLCFKNVYLSFELGSRLNSAGLSENLTLFDALTVDAAKECADVEACDSFVNALVEHFKAGDNGAYGLFDKANDFGRVTNVSNAALYTTGSNGAAAGDGIRLPGEEGRAYRYRAEGWECIRRWYP